MKEDKRLSQTRSTAGVEGGQAPRITNNPMIKAHESPRCLAKTRRGTECQSPALRGKKRCRLHGGHSTGAPKGNRNAWKHGARSAETMKASALVRAYAKFVLAIDN
jgi:hypothetical protein